MPEFFLIKNHLEKSGGLEKSLDRISSSLIQKDYSIEILTSSKKESSIPALNFKTFTTYKKPHFLQLLSFDRQVRSYLKNFPHSTILGFDRTTWQTHMRLGNGIHASFLEKRALFDTFIKKSTYFMNPLHQTILHLEKKAFQNPLLQTILCNSFMVKEEIEKFYPFVESNKIFVLHNGVEYEEMAPYFQNWSEKRIFLYQKHHLNPHKHQFLFVGNDFKRKGLLLVLQSLFHLNPEEYELSVVGSDKNINFYKSYVKKHNLESNVKFFGIQRPLYDFFILADTYILPTFYDPFANVTLEALSMGVYVLTSSHNGGKEVLKAGIGKVLENILDTDCLMTNLKARINSPKTKESAQIIRNSVKDYDFANHMDKLIQWLVK